MIITSLGINHLRKINNIDTHHTKIINNIVNKKNKEKIKE